MGGHVNHLHCCLIHMPLITEHRVTNITNFAVAGHSLEHVFKKDKRQGFKGIYVVMSEYLSFY